MSLSPEQSQQLTDLRRKMLSNVAAGKSSFDGINETELGDALSFLRSNRVSAATANAKKAKVAKATKATKATKVAVQVDTKAFTDIDLD
jgi:hypothetical protein